MAKRHMKRLASPRTWRLARKEEKFVVRPRAGRHPFTMGMSIAMVLKGLGYCATTKEVKTALNTQEIFVNGKRVKDFKLLVGLMDVLSIPSKQIYYRIGLDNKGRPVPVQIPVEESGLIPCRVNNVRKVKGGKIQLNCHNGYNFLQEKKAISPHDTLIYDITKQALVEHLPMKPEVHVLITGGALAGSIAILKERQGGRCQVELDGKPRSTPVNYVFVIGEKQPVVRLR